MSEFESRSRPTLRTEWIRYRSAGPPGQVPLRAGVPGAYLPRLLLRLPHQPQQRLSASVPQCAAMVLDYHLRERGLPRPAWVDTEWLAELLGTDEERGTPGGRLERLRFWGVRADFPSQLQFFRDGTAELDARLALPQAHLVFRWEEAWLRYVTAALREGLPPVLFVNLGRLYPRWRGLRQPHAVVLAGGDGRSAWVHDPARTDGPVRVGLCTLMDALLPGEPLAAVLKPDWGQAGTDVPEVAPEERA